jgi:hypothetical protein
MVFSSDIFIMPIDTILFAQSRVILASILWSVSLIKGLPHNFYFQDTVSTSQRCYRPYCATVP